MLIPNKARKECHTAVVVIRLLCFEAIWGDRICRHNKYNSCGLESFALGYGGIRHKQ